MDVLVHQLCNELGSPLLYPWARPVVHTIDPYTATHSEYCSSWEIEEDVTLSGLFIKAAIFDDKKQVDYRYWELEKHERVFYKGQTIEYKDRVNFTEDYLTERAK